MTVKSIEAAIRKLPPKKLAAFRRWFAKYDGAVWDAQIEADASAGKLDAMAAEARAEHRAGKARRL